MLKESEEKESRGWKYKEIEFEFEEQISMFEGVEYENSNSKKQE